MGVMVCVLVSINDVALHLAPVTTRMGDRLQTDKPPIGQFFGEPLQFTPFSPQNLTG